MSVSVPVIDHIDPAIKRIFLKAGVERYHPVTDIYTEIRNLRRTNEALRPYDMPVTAEGNKPKGGGKFTSRYSIFNHGWRVVPTTGLPNLYVDGEQITDDGQSGPECIDFSLLPPGTSITVNYEPPASELVRADAELAIITRSAYQGVVAVDVVHGIAGTAIGTGTHATPSNNIQDATAIAASLGIEALAIHGALTLVSGDNVSGMVLKGENSITTLLTVDAGANVTNCQFEDLILSNSVLDGYAYIKHCAVHNVSGIEGYVELSMLSGNISLTGTQNTYFVTCKSGCVGLGSVDLPILSLAGTGRHVAFRGYEGPIKITNSIDPDNTVCIDVSSGATLTIDPSCTAGQVYVGGIANLPPTAHGMTVHLDRQLDQKSIASAIWQYAIEGMTAEQMQRLMGSVLLGKVSGAGTGTEVFRDLADTKDRLTVIVDQNGNRLSVVRDAT